MVVVSLETRKRWRGREMGKGSGEQARLEKLGKLCELLRAKQAECFELAEEMARVAGGQAAIGDTLTTLRTFYDTVWCQRYTPGKDKQYIWQWAKDTALMKKLLKTLAVEEIERRMANYLKADDPFFLKNRHTFGIFVASINQFAEFSKELHEELPPPVGCKHLPPCCSDQEHTRRRAQDNSLGSAF